MNSRPEIGHNVSIKLTMAMVVYSLQGTITNILEENVLQPLLVSTSAVSLAAETVRSIMKIDDIVSSGVQLECRVFLFVCLVFFFSFWDQFSEAQLALSQIGPTVTLLTICF